MTWHVVLPLVPRICVQDACQQPVNKELQRATIVCFTTNKEGEGTNLSPMLPLTDSLERSSLNLCTLIMHAPCIPIMSYIQPLELSHSCLTPRQPGKRSTLPRPTCTGNVAEV